PSAAKRCSPLPPGRLRSDRGRLHGRQRPPGPRRRRHAGRAGDPPSRRFHAHHRRHVARRAPARRRDASRPFRGARLRRAPRHPRAKRRPARDRGRDRGGARARRPGRSAREPPSPGGRAARRLPRARHGLDAQPARPLRGRDAGRNRWYLGPRGGDLPGGRRLRGARHRATRSPLHSRRGERLRARSRGPRLPRHARRRDHLRRQGGRRVRLAGGLLPARPALRAARADHAGRARDPARPVRRLRAGEGRGRDDMRVAVIGAGMTGLVAAYRLAAAGNQCDVYERWPGLGGQVATLDVGDGHLLERYYHHLFTTDREIAALYEELGMSGAIEWLPSSVAIFAAGRSHPFTTPLDLLRFRPLSLRARVRMGLGALRLQRARDVAPFEAVTARDWIEREMGAEAWRVVWGPLLRGKFGDRADEISMAWLWSKLTLRRRLEGREARRELLGYPR